MTSVPSSVVVAGPRPLLTPRTIQIRLLARWELARRNPVNFFKWFVFTNCPRIADGGQRVNEVRPFPSGRPHLRHLTELFVDNPVMLVSKSRQMVITWWLAGLLAWDGCTKRHRLLMAQGKRLEDAVGDAETGDGLLGRAKFIIRHIPAKNLFGLRIRTLEERIVIESNCSTIWAIPQGGDIIRQRTASGIGSDECAFQDQFENAFMAAMPCIRSGGWFVGVTTADMTDGGFTYRVVNDLPDPDQE